ncbi:ABC transporter ATP-binding protein [Alkalinema sp. FACHB-956]|uniref:ABC transporter ATP-binding protein n=1 Tax=Alkalinema sp. FACHB-956 TaxID=2692768 RepID=UPI0016854A26|nr:ABC transporter ATP-binding protein [Alkalinema sp. FACHB-956]MBD2329044.1 ABC transporter ATP-binding protein [Alkalinema sp. FACHB-956]
MTALELQNLRKTYSTTVIPVQQINLTVQEGEFLTLLGPSGCGKSTILRLIAGLEQPTQGKILINGQDVTALSPGDRNIAMVFQSYALYPHMTVRDNIASGLKLRKVPAGEIQRRIQEVALFLGLEALMDRKPGQLSGGQRQRVAVARALVRQPAVFLLDEPLSNLDALLREQVRAELKQLFAAQSAPVVYVTHDQTEAMTLSTRVAVLYDGELQQLNTPQQIYAHPANQFVAGFIGSPQMNFWTLPCSDRTVSLGPLHIPLPSQVPNSNAVVLGIRPEQVGLALENNDRCLTGRVQLVEHLGMSWLVTVAIPASDPAIDNQPLTIRAVLPADRSYSVGDEISLQCPIEHLHWFDVTSGRAFESDRTASRL